MKKKFAVAAVAAAFAVSGLGAAFVPASTEGAAGKLSFGAAKGHPGSVKPPKWGNGR